MEAYWDLGKNGRKAADCSSARRRLAERSPSRAATVFVYGPSRAPDRTRLRCGGRNTTDRKQTAATGSAGLPGSVRLRSQPRSTAAVLVCVSLPGQGGREREQPRLAIRDWSSVPSSVARAPLGIISSLRADGAARFCASSAEPQSLLASQCGVVVFFRTHQQPRYITMLRTRSGIFFFLLFPVLARAPSVSRPLSSREPVSERELQEMRKTRHPRCRALRRMREERQRGARVYVCVRACLCVRASR